MQLEVEMGNDPAKKDQEMMNAVHYTMKYVVKDGNDMSEEMCDIAIGVCSGVARESYGVPKISAMHMMSIILTHQGQHAFAREYIRMVAEEVDKAQFNEQSGIEYG